MSYNVTLSAANAIRVFNQAPEKISADLRSFDGEIVHVSQIVYADSDHTYIVSGPSTFSLKATEVHSRGDQILLALEDGTKATFNRLNPGLTISISQASEESGDGEESTDDGEEDEAPVTRAKSGKKAKAAPVEDDEEDEEVPVKKGKAKAKAAPVEDDEDDEGDDDEGDDDDEEEVAPPKRGAKAKPAAKAPAGKKAKAAPVEDDEDDEGDDDEGDDDEGDDDEEVPVKKAKRGGRKGEADDEDDEGDDDDEEEVPVKKGNAKAAPAAKGKASKQADDDFEW